MNDLNIIVGDCREEMAKLPEQSVQCVVTSPPYWGQRDYGVNGMIGLEPDVHEWIDSMVEVFRGVWRVLRDDGTVWLNLGDKYASTWAVTRRSEIGLPAPDLSQRRNTATTAGVKEKDLIGLPWRMAFALQADGWYLRRDIIWHKPNPMPESATDRPSTAHEYIFLLTKQPHYFYDATHPLGANMRSVWKIATQPFGGAHYATYPEKLVEPCIKAGSSERGECPACGAPWERVVHQERIRERTPSDNHAVGNFQSVSDVGNRKTAPLTLGWQPT